MLKMGSKEMEQLPNAGVWGIFALKRQANTSNAFVIATSDLKRLQQFRAWIFKQYPKHRVIVWNLQSSELFELQVGENGKVREVPVQAEMGGLMVGVSPQTVLSLLREKPTIVLVSFAYSQRQADFLSDLMVAVATDDICYRLKSTLVVFSSSTSLFSPQVLRFCVVILPPPSTEEERRELMSDLAKQFQTTYRQKPAWGEEEVQASSGLNLWDLETACLESFIQTKTFSSSVFTAHKIKILSEMGLHYTIPSRGFETVGGYDYLKSYLRNRVIKLLKNPEKAREYGLDVPKGVILVGVAGTGKTWLSRALAKEIGLPQVELNPATFLRGIVGETEARVEQVTTLLESLAPVVVFIDEIDQLTLSRSAVASTDSGVSRRLTNMLLSWLGDEKRRTFLVGATNFVSDIDEAFLRAGRIDDVIPVFYPDLKARAEILQVHTQVVRRVPLNGSVDFYELAKKTKWWTGAELEKLVINASLLALEEEKPVEQEHFERAMEQFEINVREREQKLQAMIQQLRKLDVVNKHLLDQALASWQEEEAGGRLSL
jgi:ATP-dependent 26S proteasome regulatory subunit